MTLTNEARNEIVEYLENNNIQTRNMTRHPMFDSMVLNIDYRIVGELTVTDMIMTNSFYILVWVMRQFII